jgi:phosphocarrier protein HPr
MIRREVEIVNARGLHARAAAKFVKLADGFDAVVQVSKDGVSVGGDSIMGLMTLAASLGATILIEADGTEEAQALEALTELVEAGFEDE